MKIIDNISFECKKCGKCCKWGEFVFLTPEDIKRIAECLEITIRDFINRYTKREQGLFVLINKGASKECIFLNGNKCSIWKYKPEQCEKFPVKYDDRCPGFEKKGILYFMKKSNSYDDIFKNKFYKEICSNVSAGSVLSVIENSSIDSFLEDSRDVIKISSLREMFAFERIDKNHLIHKCTRDLWVIDTDKDGNVTIKRLFDNKGEPIKG